MAATKKQPGDAILPYPFASDSFLIRVTNVANHVKQGDTVHIVYYADGSLKSGKQMEELIGENRNELGQKNYVFVGIAHFGQYRVKRRRDFIPPSVKTNNGFAGVSHNYGQADSFYHFLRHGVIPVVEKQFSGHVVERSYIGHSLGGLFATYLLLNDDSLFTNLYALSPSLWIDGYQILDYESTQQDKLSGLRRNLWISCGSRETVNRIRHSVSRFSDTLNKRRYPGIHYQVRTYEGKTHHSSVGPALQEIIATFWKE